MSRRSAQRKRYTAREQKVNPRFFGMTVIDGMSQPRSMPRNIKTFMQEGYKNDTAYKVINYAIINGAAIPPVLYTDQSQVGKSDGKRIDKHDLLDRLEHPNIDWSGVFLRKSIIGEYLLTGNSFQYINRIAKQGPPDEIWTLPPDKVEPIAEQTRGITGYNYTEWSAEKNPINPQLIGHLRTWNPESPFFGMSPMEVAAIIIDQQTDARKWQLSMFQNGLKPSGAWTTTALLSPNDRSKLEARVNEKLAGFRNAGKAPVLDGALKWESSSVAPSEMDWIDSMKFNGGAIANIYNMPPQLIGDTSSTTYDNMEQAEIISYTEFIFPTLDDLYGLWNKWLLPMYPDLAKSGAYLYYDKESIEVIQKVIQTQKDAQADRALKMWTAGLGTLNECREKCGLQALGPDGDLFRFGTVIVRKEALGEYADKATAQPEPVNVPDQPPTDVAPNENPPVIEDGKQPPPPKRILPTYATKALDLTTAEEKAAYAESMEATRTKYETQYGKDLAAYFEDEREAVVQAIQSSVSITALPGRVEGVVNDNSGKLKKILLALYEDVANDVGAQVSSVLSDKKALNFTDLFGQNSVKSVINAIGNTVQQIISTTINKIKSIFGSNTADITKDVDSLYNDQFIPNRSATIAGDIAVGASNWATVEVAKQSDKELLQTWLSQHDDRVRPAHADADGQSVSIGQKFSVGGESLAYPGDPAGSPGNTCGCRCFVILNSAPIDEKSMRRDEYRRFMERVLA